MVNSLSPALSYGVSTEINRQADLFVESSIDFVTAIIWYLRKYAGGKYCTLPHVIELMQADLENCYQY